MNTKELLSIKSRELLDNQLGAFDSNNSKSGIFISISALFIPVAFSVFEKFISQTYWLYLFFIPILLNLLGIYFFIN